MFGPTTVTPRRTTSVRSRSTLGSEVPNPNGARVGYSGRKRRRRYDDVREYDPTPAMAQRWSSLDLPEILNDVRTATTPTVSTGMGTCVQQQCHRRARYLLRGDESRAYCGKHAVEIAANAVMQKRIGELPGTLPAISEQAQRVIETTAFPAMEIDDAGNVSSSNGGFSGITESNDEIRTNDDKGGGKDKDTDKDTSKDVDKHVDNTDLDDDDDDQPAKKRQRKRRRKRKWKVCAEDGCETSPSYGEEGTNVQLYCARHGKERHLVNLRIKQERRRTPCAEPDCSVRPSYGHRGTKLALYCAKHGKERDMIYVGHRTCSEEDCEKQPSYGAKGSKIPTYCAKHGKQIVGFVNVSKKRCTESGCDKEPTYGYPGTKKILCCAPHGKASGMVNVVKKKCLEPGCTVIASYGEMGTNARKYCARHGKKRGMDPLRH